MSYASSSLRSMSTASSGLSSLSTYMPLAGGENDNGAIMFAVAAAITALANCYAKTMTCKDWKPMVAAALVGYVVFMCKKGECQIDLGKTFGKLNGQGMLLGGLVGYAAFQALVLTGSNNFGFRWVDILGVSGDVEVQLPGVEMFVGIGAAVGAIM